MIDYTSLYASFRIKGSYFNKMLHCGREYNSSVETALEYLPEDILTEYKEKLAFISTVHNDACRVARHLSEEREIILLSERIFPKDGEGEGHSNFRYFIFAVLHEVVHAINKHRSPLFDNLSQEEIKAQEKEADDLALTWFNDHLKTKNADLTPITIEEIRESQSRHNDAWLKFMKKV